MTVKTAVSSAMLSLTPGAPLALALLLLPFSAKLRRRTRALRLLRLSLAAVLSPGGITLVTGCGTGSGFFGQSQQTYTIQVTGTPPRPPVPPFSTPPPSP